MVIDWTGQPTPLIYAGALAAGLVGVALHELLHILGFVIFGRWPSVRFGIRYLGIAVEPRGRPPRWQVAIASLFPVLGLAPLALNIDLFSLPMDWRLAVVLGVYVLAVIPSPGDIYTVLMYHPDAPYREVIPDG